MSLPDYASVGRLLSIKQTMELLNCTSRTTIARWVKRGILKPIKMGANKQASTKFKYDEIMWSLDNMRK